MSNRYYFITRKSGKRANIKAVSSRAAARQVKAARNFTVSIYDRVTSQVVR